MDTPFQAPFSSMRPIRSPRPIHITVGPQGADITGADDKAIQAAIDYVAALGGGTVELQEGSFVLRNALFPRSGLTLRGQGEGTVLRQAPGATSALVREADWYEYCVQVEDPRSFCAGGGIALSSGKAEWPQTKLFTITAIDGNVLYLDKRTEKNFYMCEEAVAQSAHSLIHAISVADVALEDLLLDGNAAENPKLNGNYAAGVFLQYCDRWRFSRVTCRNYHGDGFSFQVCDDVHFEHCRALDNATLGFHPGSGSQRPLFRHCEARGNDQGLFWCWGVCDGLAEHCVLAENRTYGSSIGHRDTDNVMRACRIEKNGEVGILFRQEPEAGRSPDRNRIEDCLIRDNGSIGIDVQGDTADAVIKGCRFESSHAAAQPLAVRIAPTATGIRLQDNQFSHCPKAVEGHFLT